MSLSLLIPYLLTEFTVKLAMLSAPLRSFELHSFLLAKKQLPGLI